MSIRAGVTDPSARTEHHASPLYAVPLQTACRERIADTGGEEVDGVTMAISRIFCE